MAGLIKYPVGKMGMVTGVKPTVWFAADFALFLCGAGGGAAGVSSFLYNRTAIVASLPMPGLIKFPAGKVGVVTGIKLAIRLAANLAPFRISTGGGAADVGCKVQLFGAVGICTAVPMAGGIGCPSITTNVRMGSRGADGNLRCIRLPGGFVAVYDGRMDGTAVGIIVGDGDSGSAGNGEVSKGTVALRGLNGSAFGGIVGGNKGGVGNGNVIRPKRMAITGGDREGDAGDGKIAKDRDCRTVRCCAQG